MALIFESSSGPTGARPARNADYRRALAVLLGKLRALDAVLQGGFVDSTFTQRRGISEAARRLFTSPIRLTDEPDMEALRLKLTAAQSHIGQAPGASKGGNSSKRIRLRLTVPGFSAEDAARLEAELGVPHKRDIGALARLSEARQLEEAVAQAAGKTPRPGRGQGFHLDQEVKVAVEAHAMKAASKFYGGEWAVEDVHGNQSYDLACRRGREMKHVEVKGTITDGTEVILTPNEVRHAREYPSTALFILSNIMVERSDDGAVITAGGDQHVLDPWHIDDARLTPLGFRYQAPER